jgi:hypothetical protein
VFVDLNNIYNGLVRSIRHFKKCWLKTRVSPNDLFLL